MRHILHIIPYVELGGTEKQAFSLIEALRQSCKISLLAPLGQGSAPFQSLNIDYRSFTRWDRNFFLGFSEFCQALREIQENHSIDLIHVHASYELLLTAKRILPNTPLIFTIHGYSGRQANLCYRLACFFSNWCADAVICVSKNEYDLFCRLGIQQDKLHLIYNGVSEPIINHRRSQELAEKFYIKSKESIIIGAASRLSEVKGLNYLIQAFAELATQEAHLQLVVAGRGEQENQLRKLSKQLLVDDRVIFTDYVEDVYNLVALFHVFVLPSLQETFPLACLEAMANHKPIVGTRVGGIPEQIVDGETGFLVEPKEVDSLVQKLKLLISDKELVQKMGENGYQRYKQNFTEQVMLDKTNQIYENLLVGKTSTRENINS